QTTLTAATGMGGAGAADLDTTINTLQATNTTSGDIYLQETNALTINGTGIRTLGGNGRIDLEILTGTVNVTAVITAHGSGTIRVNAEAGVLSLGANVSSTTGNITLTADTVAQNANISTGGTGTIAVTADTAGITMADGTTTTTATGNVTYTAATSIALSLLTSTSGNLALTATVGAITDNTLLETPNLVTTGTASFTAATGIGGTGVADIDTALGSLTALNTGSNGIVFEETDALTITSGGIVNQASGAPIILTTLAGTLTINGQIRTTGSGHIRLSVAGVDSDLISIAAITSGTGSITLLAARSVTLNAGASLATTGTGTLDVEAAAGSIKLADNVAVTTAGGSIRFLAAQDVTLSGLNAATGSVTIRATAGSIIDAGATLNDITAANLRLFAGVGIGSALDVLEITIATLAAAATTGGIRLSEQDDVTIGTVAIVNVNRVSVSNTTATVGDVAATSDLTTTTGAIELTSRTGSITLTDGVNADTRAITTTTGSVVLRAQNSITFQASIVSTSGDFTLTATTGALIDDTPSEGALLITTGTATLTAATGVGAANASDIDTTITSVTATNITSGGIFLHETATLIVLGATTQAGNGSISILVDTGDLTVTGAVTAHGSGNVYLRAAAGNVTVNADVASTSGHLTTLASATLTLNADLTTGGTVDLEGNLITASLTADVTAGGHVRFASATTIILGGVITTPANVSLTAGTGSITDLDTDNSVDVVASGLRLVAGLGLGTATNHLETTMATLSARATSGGIYLDETNSLTIGDVAVTIQKVNVDATVTPVTDVTQSDIRTTSGNGSIVLVTGGDLTLNDGTAAADTTAVSAHGTGNVLLSTTGAITLNADILSGSGHVTATATATLTLNADITTTGTVDLEANLITASLTADITAGADVRLVSATNIILGGVITTPANVSLIATAGSITDLDTNSAVDIVAAGLRIVAGLGLGTATNHLETTISTLSARATSGGLFLSETNALTIDDVAVTIQKVNIDASVTSVTDVTQSDVRTTAGNGAIVLTTGGDLTLNDGTAAADTTSISAHGTGNVLLATTGSITVNADIVSGSGHVTLTATATLTLNADITTSGTVDLEANMIVASVTADITAGADVRLVSATNIILGGVITTLANVSLIAMAGSITDLDTDHSVDVVAAGLRLVAGLGIATATNHLDTTIATLSARATSGGIYLNETNALTVGDVAVTIQKVNADASVTAVTDVTQSDIRTTAGNGAIVIVTGGDLTLNDGTAAA
ncbi:beta strand repeat-containing protein, partial [Oleiharenicola lentus]|uniref:beta strand repeat-containing protein n=1 Tax=Oleiharenicola lentus TaxID=2508720 RepID=UPI003F67FCD3